MPLSALKPHIARTHARTRDLSRPFSSLLCARRLHVSLRLLKHEMPGFFGTLEPRQFQWSPASGVSAAEAFNNSQHPYLRSHVLTKDYEIYDAERNRLLQRARRLGLLGQEQTAPLDFF